MTLFFPTCTDAHYKPGHDDDLVGLGNLADPHHHSGDDGEDVVEEEGTLPAAGSDGFKGTLRFCRLYMRHTR